MSVKVINWQGRGAGNDETSWPDKYSFHVHSRASRVLMGDTLVTITSGTWPCMCRELRDHSWGLDVSCNDLVCQGVIWYCGIAGGEINGGTGMVWRGREWSLDIFQGDNGDFTPHWLTYWAFHTLYMHTVLLTVGPFLYNQPHRMMGRVTNMPAAVILPHQDGRGSPWGGWRPLVALPATSNGMHKDGSGLHILALEVPLQLLPLPAVWIASWVAWPLRHGTPAART